MVYVQPLLFEAVNLSLDTEGDEGLQGIGGMRYHINEAGMMRGGTALVHEAHPPRRLSQPLHTKSLIQATTL